MTQGRVERMIAAGHPCFAGHFPGRPLVPGVVLLDEVASAIGAPLAGIGNVKFLGELKPGEAFSIRWTREGSRAQFRCEAGARLLAQGTLELG